MREFTPRFAAEGLKLAVVGNGSVKHAADFAQEEQIPFPLYTDPRRGSYQQAGLKRSIFATFNWTAVKNIWRARRGRFKQTMVRGDAWQQGGAFVFAPGNKVLFEQRSEAGGDHVDPRELIRAIAG